MDGLKHLAVKSGPRSCRRRNASKAHFNAEVSSTFQLQFFSETAVVDAWRHWNTRRYVIHLCD